MATDPRDERYLSVTVDLHPKALALMRSDYPTTTPAGDPWTWTPSQLAYVLTLTRALLASELWPATWPPPVVIAHG